MKPIVGTRIARVLCVFPVLAIAGFLTSCSSDARGGSVINVPTDEPTIQKAVAMAQSGDMVLIAKGTYNESVTVEKDGITIRGVDRNSVVLDGQGKYSNGFTITGNGVTVQNLTLHSYQQNGIIVTGVLAADSGEYAGTTGKVVNGYHFDHITAHNNGLYGIYAFASTNGVIEDSYASGHPDSGFYVGQCNPCNVVLQRNISENNAIGYYGTNASGNVWLVNSIFRNNRLGIAPNSQKAEHLAPQESTVVAGNIVDNNDNADAPKILKGFFAVGIAVGGGTKNTVTKNRVTNNKGAGILLIPMNEYEPLDNVVSENIVENNGKDLVFASPTDGAKGNCFSRNTYKTSLPANIETIMKCGSSLPVKSTLYQTPVAPDGPNFQDVVKPGIQPNMKEALTAPWSPASMPVFPTLASIKVPTP